MTKKEWLNDHPQGMIWSLRETTKVARTKAGKRKLRLFACGCCRMIWKLLKDARHRKAVQVAENFADGRATKEQLEAVRLSIKGLASGNLLPDSPETRARTAATLAEFAADTRAIGAAFYMTAMPLPLAGLTRGAKDGNQILSDLLRDIFGNPFRSAHKLDPGWLRWNDATVPRLAEQMYDSRDFAAMPILADALEEAGCTNADMLDH
jgi:hypothetical protein